MAFLAVAAINMKLVHGSPLGLYSVAANIWTFIEFHVVVATEGTSLGYSYATIG